MVEQQEFKTIQENLNLLNEQYPTAVINTSVEIVQATAKVGALAKSSIIVDGVVIGTGHKLRFQEDDLDGGFVGWAETTSITRAITIALKDLGNNETVATAALDAFASGLDVAQPQPLQLDAHSTVDDVIRYIEADLCGRATLPPYEL